MTGTAARDPAREREPRKTGRQQPVAMGREPELRAVIDRARIEAAMRAAISGWGLPEVVGTRRIVELMTVLRRIAIAGQVAVRESGEQAVAPDRRERAAAYVELATAVSRGPADGARGKLGLIDRRYRLRTVRHARAAPIELRGVQ